MKSDLGAQHAGE